MGMRLERTAQAGDQHWGVRQPASSSKSPGRWASGAIMRLAGTTGSGDAGRPLGSLFDPRLTVAWLTCLCSVLARPIRPVGKGMTLNLAVIVTSWVLSHPVDPSGVPARNGRASETALGQAMVTGRVTRDIIVGRADSLRRVVAGILSR